MRWGDNQRADDFWRKSALRYCPVLRMVLHIYQHGDDTVVFGVKGSCGFGVCVITLDGKLKPRLSLGCFTFRIVELTYERSWISPFAPRFSNVGGHRSRGSSSLVCEGVFLLFRECLAQMEDLHGYSKSTLINFQIRVTNYLRLSRFTVVCRLHGLMVSLSDCLIVSVRQKSHSPPTRASNPARDSHPSHTHRAATRSRGGRNTGRGCRWHRR